MAYLVRTKIIVEWNADLNLVVFHDHGDHFLDPFLKSGFRHVFCAVSDGTYWITVDGRMGLPVIEVVAASTFDLRSFYENEGFTVVAVAKGGPVRVPYVMSSCVGMVKTVLGVRSISVTPYQLYKFIRKIQ